MPTGHTSAAFLYLHSIQKGMDKAGRKMLRPQQYNQISGWDFLPGCASPFLLWHTDGTLAMI